ncbi:hypothetical protein JOQ06_022000, partial [Pogonophryne albipinna]
MIRIFPDFSVQVTASGVGGPGVGGGGSGGMGPQVGRIPGTSNGNPQNLQGINAYQQRSPQGPVEARNLTAVHVEARSSVFLNTSLRRLIGRRSDHDDGRLEQPEKRGKNAPGNHGHFDRPATLLGGDFNRDVGAAAAAR